MYLILSRPPYIYSISKLLTNVKYQHPPKAVQQSTFSSINSFSVIPITNCMGNGEGTIKYIKCILLLHKKRSVVLSRQWLKHHKCTLTTCSVDAYLRFLHRSELISDRLRRRYQMSIFLINRVIRIFLTAHLLRGLQHALSFPPPCGTGTEEFNKSQQLTRLPSWGLEIKQVDTGD